MTDKASLTLDEVMSTAIAMDEAAIRKRVRRMRRTQGIPAHVST